LSIPLDNLSKGGQVLVIYLCRVLPTVRLLDEVEPLVSEGLDIRAAHEYSIYPRVTRTRRYNVWTGICIRGYRSVGIFYHGYGYVKLENLRIRRGTRGYTYLLNGTS